MTVSRLPMGGGWRETVRCKVLETAFRFYSTEGLVGQGPIGAHFSKRFLEFVDLIQLSILLEGDGLGTEQFCVALARVCPGRQGGDGAWRTIDEMCHGHCARV